MNLHDLIKQVACELYMKSGKEEGRDLNNWIRAEHMVTGRYEASGDLDTLYTEILQEKKPRGKGLPRDF